MKFTLAPALLLSSSKRVPFVSPHEVETAMPFGICSDFDARRNGLYWYVIFEMVPCSVFM